jgi:hypothetical protein
MTEEREERDKWTEFVNKLNELTLKGVLCWSAVRPPENQFDDPRRFIPVVFETEYKDRRLRLYEEKVNLGKPTSPPSFNHALLDWLAALGRSNGRSGSEAAWRNYIVLALMDKNGVSWEFPNIEGLEDLLEAVKFKVAGVSEYLDAVLADETVAS